MINELPDPIKVIIFNELMTYPRFNTWVGANYQLHIMSNDEEKRVEVKVMEQDLALAQNALNRLLEEFTKDQPQVQLASTGDLKSLTRGRGKKRK